MMVVDVHVKYVKCHLSFAQFWATQYKRDIDILGTVQWGATEVNKRLEYLFSEERLWELGLLILQKRRLKGDLIDIYKHWKGPCKEAGSRLSSVVLCHKRRPWAQTETWELLFEYQETISFFKCSSGQALKKVFQGRCGDSILSDRYLKAIWYMILGYWL